MRFSIVAFTSLCICYNAAAVPLADETLPLLSEAPHSSMALDKRLTIEESAALLGVGALTLLNANAIATYVSTLIKNQSNANSCGVLSGQVDGVNYQYHAKTSGKNCDTTAELKTIKDAVDRALDFMKTHNVNQACFNLQHGGTWTGLLQLAGGDRTIMNNKCDSVTYTLTV